MSCCPTCSCAGEAYPCLAEADETRHGAYAQWCRGDDATRRAHVRNRSAIAAGGEPAPPAPGAVPPPASWVDDTPEIFDLGCGCP